MSGRRIARLALAAGLCASCSGIFSQAVPARRDPGGYPECGVTPGAIAADAVIGIAALLTTTMAAAEGEEQAFALGLVSVGFIGSAMYGVRTHRACDEAQKRAIESLSMLPVRVSPQQGDAGLPLPEAGAPSLQTPPARAPDAGAADAATNRD